MPSDTAAIAGGNTTPAARNALRDRDRPKARDQRKQQRGERDDHCRGRHQQPLRPRRIDQRARRGLRQDSGNGGDRHHDADAGLIPFLLGEKIDGEIGSKPVADVGEEEIGGVKRAAGLPRALCLLACMHVRLDRGKDCARNENGWGRDLFPNPLSLPWAYRTLDALSEIAFLTMRDSDSTE
jgi:hypothetical protein